MERRSRLDIIRDILESIINKGGVIKPTNLMYKSNMSHIRMKSYINELIKKGFINKNNKNKKEYIKITEKGFKFAQKLREIKEFEESFDIVESY